MTSLDIFERWLIDNDANTFKRYFNKDFSMIIAIKEAAP